MRVLVAEPSVPVRNALRKFLDGVADVQTATYLDEAVQVVRARAPEVLIAAVSGSFDGEVLCAQVKKLAPQTRVVLTYPPTEFERAADRAEETGADGFVVGPLKRHAVLAQLHAVLVQRELYDKWQAREAELARAKAEKDSKKNGPPAVAPVRPSTGVNQADEAFFKKYMLLEVKRSKRYRYPVALLLVALDGLDAKLKAQKAPEFQRAAIRAEVLQALSQLTRDIDLLMPFAGEKYLVFLPHTPRSGCSTVARRVVARLRELASFPGGTASVAVASFDPKVDPRAQVSFGGLVRDATHALKKAQAAGGDRVEAPDTQPLPRRSRISMG
ncbi:MAG: response regulator [Myxococcales bacterium]|nr:response regulator [Myxococcales bacterium]